MREVETKNEELKQKIRAEITRNSLVQVDTKIRKRKKNIT